jgi:hypothetical protein
VYADEAAREGAIGEVLRSRLQGKWTVAFTTLFLLPVVTRSLDSADSEGEIGVVDILR